jgi:hypothetical protein
MFQFHIIIYVPEIGVSDLPEEETAHISQDCPQDTAACDIIIIAVEQDDG